MGVGLKNQQKTKRPAAAAAAGAHWGVRRSATHKQLLGSACEPREPPVCCPSATSLLSPFTRGHISGLSGGLYTNSGVVQKYSAGLCVVQQIRGKCRNIQHVREKCRNIQHIKIKMQHIREKYSKCDWKIRVRKASPMSVVRLVWGVGSIPGAGWAGRRWGGRSAARSLARSSGLVIHDEGQRSAAARARDPKQTPPITTTHLHRRSWLAGFARSFRASSLAAWLRRAARVVVVVKV